MIIAHGPLGYLTTKLIQRWWKPLIEHRYSTRLYWIGCIGGMIPDIDLLYFYFVDSSVSHRQLITHSVTPYILLITLGIVSHRYGKWFRRSALQWLPVAVIIFGIGGITHILADSIVGLTSMVAPFSWQLMGLPAIQWYQNSILMSYQLPFILTMEAIIIAIAIWHIWKPKKWFWIVSTIAIIGIFLTLLFIRSHVYSPSGLFYYDDIDDDGILNAQDRDMDGDGILNSIDTDIDGDGEDNSLDMYRETFEADGTLYDYTNGANVEIPLRLGMLTTKYTIIRMFANVGIFFGVEMSTDYADNSTGYIGEPGNNEFSEQLQNWTTWLEHTGQLLPADTQANEFDIVFFESGHVGLFTRVEGEDHLLESHKSHVYTQQVPLTKVIEREGSIVNYGRLLPKAIEFQY